MPPISSHLVAGHIYDLYGVALAGATVTLTHKSIEPSISKTTNASGEYVINLSGLSSQWSKGDTITLVASKTAEGTKTEETTIQGTGGQIVNITLAETSDLNYYETPRNDYNLVFALLTHYDGEKVTRERPLPVAELITENTISQDISYPLFTYDSSDNLLTMDIKIEEVTYRQTFTYDSSNNVTSISKWVRQ